MWVSHDAEAALRMSHARLAGEDHRHIAAAGRPLLPDAADGR